MEKQIIYKNKGSIMNILVTGACGFVGKNLICALKNLNYNIFEYDIDTDPELLNKYTKECDFVYHLAGVNRPKDETEFMEGNFGFTSILLENLKKNNNKSPIVITSSTQAALDNPYGKSKKAGEDLIFNYGISENLRVFVYRMPNVFGKWCRPNYNSAIATFCHNISNDLEIKINDPNVVMNLLYIDDLVSDLIKNLSEDFNLINTNKAFEKISIINTIKLGEIVDLIYSFKESRENKFVPDMMNSFTKKLYSTYLSYLPKNNFSYNLKMNIDNRGSFTEFLKSNDRGQVSVNISKPGITKGNHWHNTKNEKFLVVSGKGVIRFRSIFNNDIIEYFVNGDKLEVVDIPVGYTHNIENLGDTDMVTIMWVNEPFDPEKPDTYFLEV